MKKSILILSFLFLSIVAIPCSGTYYAAGVTDYYTYVNAADSNCCSGSTISIVIIDSDVSYTYQVTSDGANSSCGDASIT